MMNDAILVLCNMQDTETRSERETQLLQKAINEIRALDVEAMQRDAIHNIAENAAQHVEAVQEALREIVRMTRNGNAADAQEQRTETDDERDIPAVTVNTVKLVCETFRHDARKLYDAIRELAKSDKLAVTLYYEICTDQMIRHHLTNAIPDIHTQAYRLTAENIPTMYAHGLDIIAQETDDERERDYARTYATLARRQTETETRTLSRKHATHDAAQTFNALANSIPAESESVHSLLNIIWNEYVELSERYEQVIRKNRDAYRNGYREALASDNVEQEREYIRQNAIDAICTQLQNTGETEAERVPLIRAAMEISDELFDITVEDYLNSDDDATYLVWTDIQRLYKEEEYRQMEAKQSPQ